MGFLVAHPSDTLEIANKLVEIAQNYSSKDKLNVIPSSIRSRYSVSIVGDQMKKIIKHISK
jgi:hypothetical protein